MVRVTLELVPTSAGEGGPKVSDGGISQEVVERLGYGFLEQSHLSKMRFVEQLPGHELMGVYFNDRLKGLWAEHGTMGSMPMTPAGLKPNFS